MALQKAAYDNYRKIIRAFVNDGFDEDAAEVYFNHVAVHFDSFEDTDKLVEAANAWFEADVRLSVVRDSVRKAFGDLASAENLLPGYKNLIPVHPPAGFTSFLTEPSETGVKVTYYGENDKVLASKTHSF